MWMKPSLVSIARLSPIDWMLEIYVNLLKFEVETIKETSSAHQIGLVTCR